MRAIHCFNIAKQCACNYTRIESNRLKLGLAIAAIAQKKPIIESDKEPSQLRI